MLCVSSICEAAMNTTLHVTIIGNLMSCQNQAHAILLLVAKAQKAYLPC